MLAKATPAAQSIFKIQLIHGILQVTMFITIHGILHQCLSKGIHSWMYWWVWIRENEMEINFTVGQEQTEAHQIVWAPTSFVTHNPAVGVVLARPMQNKSLFSCFHSKWETCKWSFHRFTYGNLVTTSPSSRWYGLLDFPAAARGYLRSKGFTGPPEIGRSDGRCVQRAGT